MEHPIGVWSQGLHSAIYFITLNVRSTCKLTYAMLMVPYVQGGEKTDYKGDRKKTFESHSAMAILHSQLQVWITRIQVMAAERNVNLRKSDKRQYEQNVCPSLVFC